MTKLLVLSELDSSGAPINYRIVLATADTLDELLNYLNDSEEIQTLPDGKQTLEFYSLEDSFDIIIDGNVANMVYPRTNSSYLKNQS